MYSGVAYQVQVAHPASVHLPASSGGQFRRNMRSMTHSGVLWQKIGLAEGRLSAASCRFWTHADLTDLFPKFLLELYATMRCGLGLMEAVRDRARLRATDPVAARVAEYLSLHMEEERHHDEWLLDDMAAIGIDTRAALLRPPGPAVAELVGAQYCWAFQVHPVALFGYLAVLEGTPPVDEQLRDIQCRTALPDEAFRCLREHARNDPHHIAELNRTLDEMPLRADHTRVIALSAFHTIDAVSRIFEELLESHRQLRAAAS